MTFWLDLKPIPQEGIPCLVMRSSQKPVPLEYYTESATVMLLNGHMVNCLTTIYVGPHRPDQRPFCSG